MSSSYITLESDSTLDSAFLVFVLLLHFLLSFCCKGRRDPLARYFEVNSFPVSDFLSFLHRRSFYTFFEHRKDTSLFAFQAWEHLSFPSSVSCLTIKNVSWKRRVRQRHPRRRREWLSIECNDRHRITPNRKSNFFPYTFLRTDWEQQSGTHF